MASVCVAFPFFASTPSAMIFTIVPPLTHVSQSATVVSPVSDSNTLIHFILHPLKAVMTTHHPFLGISNHRLDNG
eukprot:m.119721 g.119721  ORF g.119721 m.119721 type:complete len:75 (+) comp21809_c0_seq2:3927-4151(+)